jgi:small subunit ribosomal protein S4
MPKRKEKKFSRPRKIFDIALIKEENNLINKYGLKNRREVWRANFAVTKIRNIAKTLITADAKEQNEFVQRQKEKGFAVESIADVLGLSKEDYLKRRLQSIVLKKGYAQTPKAARQLVTHKHITIAGNIINSPSHLTTIKEEEAVGINIAVPEKKVISDEEKKLLKQLKKSQEEEQ